MTIARMLSALVVVVAMAGCASYAEREQAGDAIVRDLLRSEIGDDKGQLAVTALGTLLGRYLGTKVGRSLDRADRRHAEDAARKSLETSPAGQAARWRNPDTGHAGTFTPINTYRSLDGLLCRDYEQSVTIVGRTQDTYGTACLADEGSWRIVETPVRRATRRKR